MSASLDSSFSQVTFTNIQESYCYLKDLECHFSVSSALTPNYSDVIGVFKVGWKSTKEYMCSKTVAVPADFKPDTILTSTMIFTGEWNVLTGNFLEVIEMDFRKDKIKFLLREVFTGLVIEIRCKELLTGL